MNLTGRLLGWMLGPLLFFWLISIVTTYLAAVATANFSVDQHLESVAQVLKSEWLASQSLPTSSLSPSGLPAAGLPAKVEFPSTWSSQWLLQGPKGEVSFAVIDEFWNLQSGVGGIEQPLYEYQSIFLGSLGCVSGSLSDGIDLEWSESLHRLRCLELSNNKPRRLLIVAQNKQFQAPLIHNILLSEAIPQAVILLLALALVWYGVDYVSRPMRQLHDQISARGSQNLSAIESQNLPYELEPLMRGINQLMMRLQQSTNAQQRFISDAAHQLRTPLAALRTQSELLASLPEGPQRQHTLQRLLNTTGRAIRLSTQLLSLARAESACTTADRASVDLKSLCESVATDVAETAMSKDLEFSYEAGSAEFKVFGDETLLGELIRNLLDNAFKYTPRNGTVHLSLRAQNRELWIEDSGPGIPTQDRESIFAPFARRTVLDSEKGHAIAGSGLGLAIVREVARAHNAEITIADSSLGGARFALRFL